MLTDNRFSVIAALPRNDLALAEAALEGGAQAVKVHCNVWHRASGNTFGTFAENRTFLRELIALCGDVPVGLVPGGEDAYINEEERLELEEMGLSFFSSYAQYVPCHMMESTRLSSMIAHWYGLYPEYTGCCARIRNRRFGMQHPAGRKLRHVHELCGYPALFGHCG